MHHICLQTANKREEENSQAICLHLLHFSVSLLTLEMPTTIIWLTFEIQNLPCTGLVLIEQYKELFGWAR